MDEHTQWQPAKIVVAHGIIWTDLSPQELQEALSKVYRVREALPSPEVLATYRNRGCNATRFYLVHPQDLPFEDFVGRLGVCEHEIVTD